MKTKQIEKTEKEAAEFIRDYIQRKKKSGKGTKENYDLKIATIKSSVCAFFGKEVQDLSNRTRKEEFVNLRYIVYFFIKKYCTLMSHESVGKIFGYDHATVMHALKCVNNQIETNKMYRDDINELDALIDYEMKLIDNSSLNVDDYYFVNLDDISILRFSSKKSVVFSGISKEEIDAVQKLFKDNSKIRTFNKTGLHLLKKIEA